MTLFNMLATILSLCSACAGGVVVKCFCCKAKTETIQDKEDDDSQSESVEIKSMEVEHYSNHTIEDIVTEVAKVHQRNSKEGSDIQTSVDIAIKFHSITQLNNNDEKDDIC